MNRPAPYPPIARLRETLCVCAGSTIGARATRNL